jgi:hypothetical protein
MGPGDEGMLARCRRAGKGTPAARGARRVIGRHHRPGVARYFAWPAFGRPRNHAVLEPAAARSRPLNAGPPGCGLCQPHRDAYDVAHATLSGPPDHCPARAGAPRARRAEPVFLRIGSPRSSRARERRRRPRRVRPAGRLLPSLRCSGAARGFPRLQGGLGHTRRSSAGVAPGNPNRGGPCRIGTGGSVSPISSPR